MSVDILRTSGCDQCVSMVQYCFTSTETIKLVRKESPRKSGFQARSKDREILEKGGGAGPSTLPRRDHE